MARNKVVADRAGKLLNLYGLTHDDYDKLLLSQAGVCGICGGTDEKRLHVDHIEIDGKPHVRGLLCRKCNLGLGHFEDSVERLLAAVNYLYHKHK